MSGCFGVMCGFYDEDIKKNYAKVKDNEFNQLFQAVRKLDEGYFLVERTIDNKKNIFSRTEEKIVYTLMRRAENIYVQYLLNNTEKSTVDLFFRAFLIGYECRASNEQNPGKNLESKIAKKE